MTKIEEDFKRLARYYISLFEGDTHQIDNALILLKKYEIIDENCEEIHEEAEE